MKTRSRERPVFILCVLAAFLLVGCQCSPKAVFLSGDQPVTFVCRFPRFTYYWALLPNGTYQEFQGEGHLHLAEIDRGRWSRKADGTLVFVPEVAVRGDIVSAPFCIRVRSAADYAELLTIRTRLAEFLDRNEGPRYPIDVNQDVPLPPLAERHVAVIRDCPNEYFRNRTYVTREELRELMEAVNRFIADPTARALRARLLSYGNRTFLLWENRQGWHGRSLSYACHELDHAIPGDEEQVTMLSSDDIAKAVSVPVE